MAYVSTPSGQALRLRLFPKPKVSARARRVPSSLSLFDPPAVDDDIQDLPAERLAARIAALCLLNRNNAAIVERFSQLGIRDWWLGANCLFQTVWNLRAGRAAERGIVDYDIFYFSEDVSWEAEDDVIRAARAMFADLAPAVRVRNQARVHVWFPEKFGVAYPPLTTAAEGILRLPCGAAAVGIRRTGEGYFDFYAPFGLGDVWERVARPNRALPLARSYGEFAAAWQAAWPEITVFPWVEDEAATPPKPDGAAGAKSPCIGWPPAL